MAKMYKKNDEVRTLAEWMQDVKMYDLELFFADGSIRHTQTIAFEEKQAMYNGFHMSFGNGRPIESIVVGAEEMSVRKFKKRGYIPANIGLKEIDQ